MQLLTLNSESLLHVRHFKCKGMLVLAVLSFRYTFIIYMYMYFDSQADVQLDKGNPSGSCGCSSSTKDLQ